MKSNINWSLQCITTTVSLFIFFLQAQSTSLSFSSLLDNGLNYCNLYKLLSGQFLFSTWITSIFFIFIFIFFEWGGDPWWMPNASKGAKRIKSITSFYQNPKSATESFLRDAVLPQPADSPQRRASWRWPTSGPVSATEWLPATPDKPEQRNIYSEILSIFPPFDLVALNFSLTFMNVTFSSDLNT